MPATEVLSVMLLPGSDVSDPNSSTTLVLKDTMETVSKQNGCQYIYFGTRVEDPLSLYMVVEWESLESHHKFMGRDYYKAFVDHFLSITNGQFLLVHVDFQPQGNLEKVLSAPITTMTTFYFENGKPPSDYESSAQKFFDNIGNGPDGYHGHAIGRTYEDVDNEGTEGKVVVLAAGWDSTKTSQEFHESTGFRENSRHLRHGVCKASAYDVHFTKFVPAS